MEQWVLCPRQFGFFRPMWLLCIILYLSLSTSLSIAHRVNLLPSTNVNQIHSSAKLAQQIEDSSLVLAPLTFTWLQCPQPSISVGSSDTKEDPIDLSVQFQCDVLSRISSGPPAVSLSAALDSFNLHLEATDATFSLGALELVAVSHSSVMGSVPILDVKIIYHIEGSIATPYAIANASVAIPSVLHEIGSRQCLKSTETCASPLLSISGSHLKGFEALTGRVYVSRIDMPQHVCVKEFICPKVKQVIISLRTPSSGPVSLLGAYGVTRSSNSKRDVFAAPRAPIPAPASPPPTQPPVAPISFSAVMVIVASALGVLLVGGLGYFGYRMYMKYRFGRPPPATLPPKKEKGKKQTRPKGKKRTPARLEQVEVELDEPEPILRKRELEGLLVDFKATIAILEASGELGPSVERAQQHISDADKAALSRVLFSLRPVGPQKKPKNPKPENPKKPKVKKASPPAAPAPAQPEGHSQLMESVESPRTKLNENPPPRGGPSVSSRAPRLNLSPVDDLYRGIDLRSLSARPPPSPSVQEIAQNAVKLTRRLTKSISQAFRKKTRARAEVHVSGLTSTNPITGATVADTATLSIMFPPVFGVPDGYAFLQQRTSAELARYTTALHSTTSSDEVTEDLSFTESVDVSSFGTPSYMNDPRRKTTVQLFGTARFNGAEGSTEVSYFDVTEDSYRSEPEATSHAESEDDSDDGSYATSDDGRSDNGSNAAADDGRSIGWGSESESDRPRAPIRKLTVALPVISVDHLWSPRSVTARGPESTEPVGTCYCCKIKDANAIFEPCRHGGICITCARNLAKLPKAKCTICRHLIISVRKTL